MRAEAKQVHLHMDNVGGSQSGQPVRSSLAILNSVVFLFSRNKHKILESGSGDWFFNEQYLLSIIKLIDLK
ncbi:hypothetical protein SCA6_007293 [Theobroma cacao]